MQGVIPPHTKVWGFLTTIIMNNTNTLAAVKKHPNYFELRQMLPELSVGTNIALYYEETSRILFFVVTNDGKDGSKEIRYKLVRAVRSFPVSIHDDDYLVVVKSDGEVLKGEYRYQKIIRDSDIQNDFPADNAECDSDNQQSR